MAPASRRRLPAGEESPCTSSRSSTRIRGSSTCWITPARWGRSWTSWDRTSSCTTVISTSIRPRTSRRTRWRWHQDGGIQNRDLETDPRPRLSLKVAFFLTDLRSPDRGNFLVVPGSHVRNTLERASDDDAPAAIPILAAPGDAVVFDRRLWHMRGPNPSDRVRKALFFAYTYRWIRPRDDLALDADRRRAPDARRSGSSWGSTRRPTSIDGCPTTRISPCVTQLQAVPSPSRAAHDATRGRGRSHRAAPCAVARSSA